MKTSRLFSVLLITSAVCVIAQAASVSNGAGDEHSGARWKSTADMPAQRPHAVSPGKRAIAHAADMTMLPILANSQFGLLESAPYGQAKASVALAYLNLPQPAENFSVQSGVSKAGKDTTELAGKFEAAKSIAEPASEVLMLVALSALAIAVRRQLPT